MSTARTIGIIGGLGLLGLLIATGAKAGGKFIEVDEPPPPKPSPGPSGGTASKKVWRERQTALAYLSGLGVCDCHPGDIDGKYGSDTIRALKAFQRFAGIDQDGKWGSATDAAMKKTLVDAARGSIEIPVEEPPEDYDPYIVCPSASWVRGKLPPNVEDYNIDCWTRTTEIFDLSSHPHTDPLSRIPGNRYLYLSIELDVEPERADARNQWHRDYRRAVEVIGRLARLAPDVAFSVRLNTSPEPVRFDIPESWRVFRAKLNRVQAKIPYASEREEETLIEMDAGHDPARIKMMLDKFEAASSGAIPAWIPWLMKKV